MGAETYLPERSKSVAGLRSAAANCEGCDLFRRATQTVFGWGKVSRPQLMLVGEQPGDEEDRIGKPFVGPAGALLDKALEQIGLDRRDLYVTNAVKHFKWEPKGNRRLHKNPSAREVAACRPWLLAEIAAVRPSVVVCLGASAAKSLLGNSFRVTTHRGTVLTGPHHGDVVATVHPASILRIRDKEDRHSAYEGFVEDLRRAARTATGAHED